MSVCVLLDMCDNSSVCNQSLIFHSDMPSVYAVKTSSNFCVYLRS